MPRRSSIASGFPLNASAGRIKPPPDLVGPERALFLDLVMDCEPDHFRRSDSAALCIYCKAVIEEKVAAAGMQASGPVSEDGKVWASRLKEARRDVSTYSRLLRLNPVARVPLPVKREAQSLSYYDRMEAMESGDGEGKPS